MQHVSVHKCTAASSADVPYWLDSDDAAPAAAAGRWCVVGTADPPPSRYALDRARKQQGEPIAAEILPYMSSLAGASVKSRLSSEQLDALEAKPAAERTPADNLALRNRRKNQKRKLKQTQSANVQHVSYSMSETMTGSDAAAWPAAAAASIAAPPASPCPPSINHGQNQQRHIAVLHMRQLCVPIRADFPSFSLLFSPTQ